MSTYYELGTVLVVGEAPVIETKFLFSWNIYACVWSVCVCVCVHVCVHGGGNIINTHGKFT